MRKTLAIVAVVLLVSSPAKLLAPAHDHGLGKTSGDLTELLAMAQQLLGRASQGDIEAMYELGKLFRSNWARTGSWFHQAAVRGHEEAMTALIFHSLDYTEPSYYTAWAWIQAGYKLGVLAHPHVGTYGYRGEGTHDEQWFRERMKPEVLQRAYRHSDRLYRWVMENAGGTQRTASRP